MPAVGRSHPAGQRGQAAQTGDPDRSGNAVASDPVSENSQGGMITRGAISTAAPSVNTPDLGRQVAILPGVSAFRPEAPCVTQYPPGDMPSTPRIILTCQNTAMLIDQPELDRVAPPTIC